jgi:anthranilate/para-aminobenzoate synthase component I
MTKAQYLERLAQVKRHIFDGNTYRVNDTLKDKFDHEGPPLRLFADLRKRQRVQYGALLDCPGVTVLSRSPELFVEKKGEDLHTRPMKGTAKRGETVTAKVDEDISLQRVLSQLFPCGSITGAPKVRTMEIINELELEPRGVYTGAIAYLGPDHSMGLNVAICTWRCGPTAVARWASAVASSTTPSPRPSTRSAA